MNVIRDINPYRQQTGRDGSSVQFSSVAQSCLTLCDPMNRSTPGLPVHHQLPESTQTHVHWVRDAMVVSGILTLWKIHVKEIVYTFTNDQQVWGILFPEWRRKHSIAESEIIEAQMKLKSYIHRQVPSVGEDSRYCRCPHCHRGELLVQASEGCGQVLPELCSLRPSKSRWW